ncbi:shieldin complex subunit 1-like [Hemitrygon akajei]|uniref:shieldin complex subunit 1-like n=1 Tax=Hemitrygon akajei TaxID=2704970 RepID=UPI003BFA2403
MDIMSANEFLPSDLSECNSVLDLPATFSLPVGDGCTLESTISTLFSAKHTINTGSDHPDCEEGIASVEAAELHPNSEDKQRCTGVTQTMEDFFQETEQRKPLQSNVLSEKIVHLLTSKIAQLKQEKGGQYLLRSFQMALVLFHTHGPDIFKQRNSNNMHFCSSVNLASDSTELHPLPGLSQDVVNFIQREISK